MTAVATCLWFGRDLEAAVHRYVDLVPGSRADHVQCSPGPWPGGEAGDLILIDLTLGGQRFQALNGGAPADDRRHADDGEARRGGAGARGGGVGRGPPGPVAPRRLWGQAAGIRTGAAVAMILLALVLSAAQPEQPVAPASPDPQPAAAASKATKTSDRDRVVCRASTQTGRHIVDRVCHTQSEWDRMEAGGKAYVDFATHGQNGCPGYTGGHC